VLLSHAIAILLEMRERERERKKKDEKTKNNYIYMPSIPNKKYKTTTTINTLFSIL